MSAAWQALLRREAAVHALAGGNVCPEYGLSAWVCSALHLVTGVCRTVTSGRFDRTNTSMATVAPDPSGIYRAWIAHVPFCPHLVPGFTYWSRSDASTVDPERLRAMGAP